MAQLVPEQVGSHFVQPNLFLAKTVELESLRHHLHAALGPLKYEDYMPRLLLKTIFAILIFTVATSQTRAASTWILWSKSSVASPIPGEKVIEFDWEPKAFETRKECEAARYQSLNRKAEPNQTIEKIMPNTLVFRVKDTKELISILVLKECLPDTIKPN